MAQDTYTEVTREGWFGRLGGAFKGILVGLFLIAVAFFLLFWNEGRAVERYKTLVEGGGLVVSVASDRVDPANEGRLVHVSGLAENDEILTDETFGVVADAIHLERRVEMYQWQESQESETRKKVGGGTETTTTYSYSPGWSDRVISSSSFKRPEGHENPGSMPYESRSVSSSSVALGAFQLSRGLIGKIRRWEPLAISSRDSLPGDLRWRAQLSGEGLYIGRGDPSSPQIGDVKVSFRQVKPVTVSLVAQQTGSTFQPYQARAGGTIELLQTGVVGAEAMFQAAQRSNTILTWLLRLGGFLLMLFGLNMVFRPLSVVADVLPFLGNLVGAGTGFVAFLLASIFSLLTVSIAWVFYRPLLGVSLLVLVVAGVVALRRRVKKTKVARAPVRAAPPPPPPAVPPTAVPPPPPPAGG